MLLNGQLKQMAFRVLGVAISFVGGLVNGWQTINSQSLCEVAMQNLLLYLQFRQSRLSCEHIFAPINGP